MRLREQLAGSTVLLTGVTGFVGEALLARILRDLPDTSVVALVRDRHVDANPKSNVRFQVGDLLGLIGDAQELATANQLIAPVGP